MSKNRTRRLAVNVYPESGDRYTSTAQKMNMSVSAFVGFLAEVGYRQLMENPEIITKVMRP